MNPMSLIDRTCTANCEDVVEKNAIITQRIRLGEIGHVVVITEQDFIVMAFDDPAKQVVLLLETKISQLNGEIIDMLLKQLAIFLYLAVNIADNQKSVHKRPTTIVR